MKMGCGTIAVVAMAAAAAAAAPSDALSRAERGAASGRARVRLSARNP